MLTDRRACRAGRPPSDLHPRASITRTLLVLLMVICTGCSALKRCAYEGFNRDEWQKPDQVIEALHLTPGDLVADLGSGSGYFTFRLADAVGPNGKVYAVDVDADMNAYVEEQASIRGYPNIEVITARPHDPGLPDRGVDLVLTCNTYHHLDNRPVYFEKLQQALKPDGRVAIIDFNGEGWLTSLTGHATPAETIKRDMEKAGYTLLREYTFLPRQVFLVFLKSSPE